MCFANESMQRTYISPILKQYVYLCIVRMKLRSEYAKLDSQLYEMALESAGFDETRARALLSNLVAPTSASNLPSTSAGSTLSSRTTPARETERVSASKETANSARNTPAKDIVHSLRDVLTRSKETVQSKRETASSSEDKVLSVVDATGTLDTPGGKKCALETISSEGQSLNWITTAGGTLKFCKNY